MHTANLGNGHANFGRIPDVASPWYFGVTCATCHKDIHVLPVDEPTPDAFEAGPEFAFSIVCPSCDAEGYYKFDDLRYTAGTGGAAGTEAADFSGAGI